MQSGQWQGSSIGSILAQARIARGLSVEQVSATTRIRSTLIRQIEDDDFSHCGGAVYARGHIRGMAKAVGVDSLPLVAEFDRAYETPIDRIATGPLEPDSGTARHLRDRGGTRWLPAMVVALAVVCVVALALLLVPGKGGGAQRQSGPSPPPTGPASPTAGARTTAPPPLAFAGVNLRMTVQNGPSWVSVTDDTSRQLLQQVLQPGDMRDFKAARRLVVVIGNANAIALACNGKQIGSPGAAGRVQTFVFGVGPAGDCTAQAST